MRHFRTSILLGSFLAIGLLVTSCKKDQVGGVPPTAVDISININLPAYADLAVPGGWLYLTGGSQGIIVYRVNNDEFVAMDRHCPYQPQNGCKVVVDDTQVIARDTACCGSAYLIIDGSVSQGPSSFGLKRYNTLFNGTTLRIYS
jgi:nitrite reductase/ring-hydroxylating ferredoxin subunit